MGCLPSIKNYVEKVDPAQGNFLERSGNTLLSPLRWVFTEYKDSKNCVKKAALIVAGSIALAFGLIGAVFKSLGSCLPSETIKNKKIDSTTQTKKKKNSSKKKSKPPTTTRKGFFGKSLTDYSAQKAKNLSRLQKKEKALDQAAKKRQLYSTMPLSEPKNVDLIDKSAAILINTSTTYQKIGHFETLLSKLSKKVEARIRDTKQPLSEKDAALLRSFVQESKACIQMGKEGLRALQFDKIGNQDVVSSVFGSVFSLSLNTVSAMLANNTAKSTMNALEFAERMEASIITARQSVQNLSATPALKGSKLHKLHKQAEKHLVEIGNKIMETMEVLHPGLKNTLLISPDQHHAHREESRAKEPEFQLL